ncbi:hypothetical protein [Roseovarius sp. E0-M6]|uniref:hypothetical protein n=1 Tax=Roseovarius sp. E0-M6 TaxID=3127118 RepID=UPI00300FA532
MAILHAMSRKSALVSGSALALMLLASPATSFEPHGAPPPVTTPPQQPPRVYAPPVLPPESQAIPSRKPSATAPKQTSPSQPAAAPKKSADQIAREKAAAEARAKARETGRTLQQLLGELGHDPGPVDGIVGRKTMDAIFGWIAGIEDPDVQQEARVAAHNDNYAALAEIAYKETLRPKSPAIARGEPASGDNAAPPEKDATVGMTQNDAIPEQTTEPEAEPEPEVAQAPDLSEEPATDPEGATEAELPPPPPPYVWGAELEAAANAAAQFLASELRIKLPDANGEISAYSSTVVVNRYGRAYYSPTSWKNRTDEYLAHAQQTTKELYADIAQRQQSIEQMRAEMAEYQAKIDDLKAVAISRIPKAQATWRNRVQDAENAIAEIEARSKEPAPKGLYESLERARNALANAAENTTNSYKNWMQYRNAQKQIDFRTRDIRRLRQQIQVLQWNAEKVQSAGAAVRLYAESMAAAAAGEVFDDPEVVEILTAEAERQEAISQSQQDMDTFLSNRAQAEAELKSLNDRADLSAEQKARIAKDINARLAFNDTLLREAQTKLAAQGASFDGYDGKDMTEFNPYAINQTDIELTRIAQEAEATDRFYDEIRLARETIRDTADGLDAITLQERVTDISERLAGNAEDINKLAEQVHDYSVNIRVTREQGELEHLSALADLAVIDAEENLAYTRSVVTTSKNANLLLALGAGAGSALGIGGVTAAEVASAQAVMAAMDGTTGAIEGFDNGGFGEALKQGAAESGKYYLPINTVMAVDRGDDKTGLALSVLSDAAMLFTGYKTARTHLDKARAAKAAVTRQTLGASEKAVSDAARRAVDKADDLIANYQKAKWTAQQARATGMVDEVAETTLQRAVKAIDRSDEAKLALKARDSKLQYLFVRDQTKIVKAPASAAWEKNMRDLGWSDTALRTEQIRNRSSAGTVGLDDDIRLLEPSLLDTLDDGVTPRYSGSNDPALLKARADFRKSLTRRGESASLAQWEQDAKTAMEKAYRETAGYAASDARVNMTTSVNPEAYSDIGLLTGDGGSAGWAEQTSGVTQTKIRDGVEAAEAMGLGSSNPNTSLSGAALEAAATETKVASRELLKDLVGKAMRTRPDVALPRKVERQLSILDGLSRGILDPAVANRQLINETGTTLAKTMETLGGQVEVLLKLN